MNVLTKNQKIWLLSRDVKVGGSYPFPSVGLTVYPEPHYENSVFIDTNPWTKSLAHERFKVKEIKNGLCKGNFEYMPKPRDFWIEKIDLEIRGPLEIMGLFIVCFVPLVIYNIYKRVSKT